MKISSKLLASESWMCVFQNQFLGDSDVVSRLSTVTWKSSKGQEWIMKKIGGARSPSSGKRGGTY